MKPEQIEGDMWLRCDRRWERAERLKVRLKPSGTRRFLKHQAARLMRRMGRELLDDAPRRVPYHGYEY